MKKLLSALVVYMVSQVQIGACTRFCKMCIRDRGYCVILFKIIMIDHPMDYNEDIVSATEDIENLSEQTEKLLWFRRGCLLYTSGAAKDRFM